jgi:hypothetical protein
MACILMCLLDCLDLFAFLLICLFKGIPPGVQTFDQQQCEKVFQRPYQSLSGKTTATPSEVLQGLLSQMR